MVYYNILYINKNECNVRQCDTHTHIIVLKCISANVPIKEMFTYVYVYMGLL